MNNPADFSARNLQILEQHHPAAHASLQKDDAYPAGRLHRPDANPEMVDLLIPGPDGRETSLHHDPVAETADYLQRVPANEPSVVAFLGMGLGYAPEAILAQRPQVRHLILIEADPAIFRQALASRDLGGLLSDPRLIVAIGPDPDLDQLLRPAIKALQLEHIHVLRHLPSFAVAPQAYRQLHQEIYDRLNQLNIGGSTMVKMGRTFFANRFHNLSAIRHQRLIDALRDRFQGVPAILVASGPSLDRNIHQLKGIRDRALIIAIDSALPSLLAHDIRPHFITALDPDDSVYEKVAASAGQGEGINLICQAGVTPKLAKTFPASQVFWAFNNAIPATWLNQQLGGTIAVGEAHSNAHLNLYAALIMGASPIILVGQDLAFTGEASHSEHTVLKEHDIWKKRLRDQDDSLWTEGLNGERVRTHRGFYGSKQLFEQIIAAHPNHYINATAAGVRLQGTEELPLEEALARYCRGEFRISDQLEAVARASEPPRLDNLRQTFAKTLAEARSVLEAVAQVREQLEAMGPELERLRSEKTLCQSLADLPAPLYQRFVTIDEHNRTIDNARELWLLLAEVTLAQLKQSERLQHELQRLTGRPEQFHDWLAVCHERLTLINQAQHQALTGLVDSLTSLLDHFNREEELLAAIDQENTPADPLLALARLYYASKDFNRLRLLLTKLPPEAAGQPETLFYQGCLQGLWQEFNAMEELFNQAVNGDGSLQEQIDRFRAFQGDAYLAYAETYREIDRPTARAMLVKGLRYSPGHPGLARALAELAELLISEVDQRPADNRYLQPLLTELLDWTKDCASDQRLARALPADQQARLHTLAGSLLIELAQPQPARAHLEQALAANPDSPEAHLVMTSLCFQFGDFDQAIGHLQRAVALDRSYGRHWEEIGDLLQGTGQIQEAVTAYEQSFLALPEQIELLRKIGDCYQRLDQPEAALEAYSQLKARREIDQSPVCQ